MNALTQAIYDLLIADATIIALLATYGGGPAVFTIDPVPGDAVPPYIVTVAAVARGPFDSKVTRGLDIRRDIRCYTDADGSSITVDAIAERVWELFHRQPLAVAGYGVLITECSGPIEASEQHAYGRIVTVRIVMEE